MSIEDTRFGFILPKKESLEQMTSRVRNAKVEAVYLRVNQKKVLEWLLTIVISART